MIAAYHSSYYANEITWSASAGSNHQLSMTLSDTSVDLNRHQIETAMFALQPSRTEGVILADEVGLGKTIEPAIALRQKRANQLWEKFRLPALVLDAKSCRQLKNRYSAARRSKLCSLSAGQSCRASDKPGESIFYE